ncbi:MAG: hypothetical protein ACOX5R_18150 [bacterium]|jgi:hypothetical protein
MELTGYEILFYALSLLAACLLVAGGIFGIISYHKNNRKLIPPPESGSGWSNNAIRRQGKSGKGIR